MTQQNDHIESPADNSPVQPESDIQKIVHRHLANKDDIITDEDLRKVRIGGVPSEDTAIPTLSSVPASEPTISKEESGEANNDPLASVNTIDR